MYEYKVKEVVKVVDGDTIDVVIDLGFDLSKKERVRLAGIDTPESRTRDLDEKKLGLEAKEYLSTNLSNANDLMISTKKDGKYGRMLGTIYIYDDIVSMNRQMIDKGGEATLMSILHDGLVGDVVMADSMKDDVQAYKDGNMSFSDLRNAVVDNYMSILVKQSQTGANQRKVNPSKTNTGGGTGGTATDKKNNFLVRTNIFNKG